MIGRRRCWMALWPVLLTVALASRAASADVRVSATIEPRELFLGDRATLSVAIEGDAENVGAPSVPDVSGLTIQQRGGASQRTQIINGRLTHRSITYQYDVSAAKLGDYTIPPITVAVGGTNYTTDAVSVRVIKPPQGGAMRLTVELSTKECWQGEPVEAVIKWAVQTGMRVFSYELNVPLLESSQQMPIEAVVPSNADVQELQIGDRSISAQVSRARLDGASFDVYTIRVRFYPDTAGDLTIPAAGVVAVLGTPTNQRDIWGDRVYDQKRQFAASPSAQIRIKALPVDGRPPGFDGAVGRFDVSTEVSDTRAHVDDPLRLTVTVSGDGLLERVKRPVLSTVPAFAERFKVQDTLEPGEIKGDSIAFEQVIRPKSADVHEIPAVPFAYFDAEAGAYRVARSDPIPITVLPTTAQSIETFGAAETAPAATELTRRPGGIYANITSYSALENEAPSFAPLWALVVPPLAYVFFLLATRRRRRLSNNVALARSSRAWRAWSSRLGAARRQKAEEDGAALFDAVAGAVGAYISDRLNLGRGELTGSDVRKLVEETRLPAEIGASALSLLERCDAARFAPGRMNTDERQQLLDEAEAFGRAAERTLRRTR